jgi:transcriptional regulator with XRE-family HTH domain
MPRRSVKEDKTVYQLSRERAGLTREAAAERLEFLSAARIEKIESERSEAHPEEVLAMAEVYGDPLLRNTYCTQACPIGRKYVPRAEAKPLSQITLEMVVTLGELMRDRDRLMEITVDGTISPEEERDFRAIRENLERMSAAIESLKLWVDGAMEQKTRTE